MRKPIFESETLRAGSICVATAVAGITMIAGAATADIVGSATGFLINGQGYLVTNYHVLGYEKEDGEEVFCSNVEVSGGPVSGFVDIVGLSPNLDLAVLQIRDWSDKIRNAASPVARLPTRERNTVAGPRNLAAELRDNTKRQGEGAVAQDLSPAKVRSFAVFASERPRSGQAVVAVGFPYSFTLSDQLKVVTGVIASTTGPLNDVTQMQHSAPVNPGNSGGPLFDGAGRVLGVNVAILSEDYVGGNPQNVSFAIHSRIVTDFLDTIGVAYFVEQPAKTRRTEDIVFDASHYTVKLLCHD